MSETAVEKWDRIYTKNIEPQLYSPIKGLARWLLHNYKRDCGSLPIQIAEVGCGHGELSAAISEIMPYAAVTGMDISQVMIDRLTENHPQVNWLQCDARDSLPIQEGSADLLIVRLISLLNGRDYEREAIRGMIAQWGAYISPLGTLVVTDMTDFSGFTHDRGWYMRTWMEIDNLYSHIDGLTLRDTRLFPEPYGYGIGMAFNYGCNI